MITVCGGDINQVPEIGYGFTLNKHDKKMIIKTSYLRHILLPKARLLKKG